MQEVKGREQYEMAQDKCSGYGGQCSCMHIFGTQDGESEEKGIGD